MIHANTRRGFCLHLGGRGIREATRVDVIGYVNTAKSQRVWRNKCADGTGVESKRDEALSRRTLVQRKEILKLFFRWMRGTDDKDPPEAKGLKIKRTEDHIPTDQLITRDDLTKLLQAHLDVHEKARIAVLYESGFRAGEFCALNIAALPSRSSNPARGARSGRSRRASGV